jgi:hypothetical protein
VRGGTKAYYAGCHRHYLHVTRGVRTQHKKNSQLKGPTLTEFKGSVPPDKNGLKKVKFDIRHKPKMFLKIYFLSFS